MSPEEKGHLQEAAHACDNSEHNHNSTVGGNRRFNKCYTSFGFPRDNDSPFTFMCLSVWQILTF